MEHDDLIWKLIGEGFCSYKTKVDKVKLCRNVYNLTGMCKVQFCPLSNSKYATVREHEGRCYLYLKEPERAHRPKRMWEKIKLSSNYMKALEQIDENLLYWPVYMKHKCKQRLTLIFQSMIRAQKLKKLRKNVEMVHINKKVERRERKREAKAFASAKIEKSIENELLQRLKDGVFEGIPEEAIFNVDRRSFNKALNVEQDENIEEEEDEDGEQQITYVEAVSSDEEDYEQLINQDVNIEEIDENLIKNKQKKKKTAVLKKRKLKKPEAKLKN